METYVASTAPFSLVFWLDDPSDPARPAQGYSLDQPVLTADGQPVTGRIEITLSVTTEHAYRLLQLRRTSTDEISASDVSNAIKGELLAKVLALELYRYTSDELRGNRRPFQEIYGSINTELASTFSGYGLRLNNFNVSWGLTFQEREDIQEARHKSAVRGVEREGELEQARRGGEPAIPPASAEQELSPGRERLDEPATAQDEGSAGDSGSGGPSVPGSKGERERGLRNPRWAFTLAVVAIAGLAGLLVYFTVFDSSSEPQGETAAAIQVVTSAPLADRNCSDFETLPEAQYFYEGAGGPASDPHRLDLDRDGIACEEYFPDRSPMATPPTLETIETRTPAPTAPTPTAVSKSTPKSSERTRGDLSCFEPDCSQRSDPLKDSFDNFLVEATFVNPTSSDRFSYGFTIEGAFQNGVAEHIEIRIANDRAWRAYVQKVVHESAPVNVGQWQVEIDGGEIPEAFISTHPGGSNRLEATIIGDEGCLYANAILISCFDISGRSITREIMVSSDVGDVLYNGFIAREAPTGA